MKQLTDNSFERFIETDKAIVMFSAPWAGPCNLVRPNFEEVAGKYGNQIAFGEFNLDDNPNTPEKYGVRLVPLFTIFVNGKPTRVVAGAVPKETLEDMCVGILK